MHSGLFGDEEPPVAETPESTDVGRGTARDACAAQPVGTAALAKKLYLQRAASVECANAQLRRRGRLPFPVRGLQNAKAVALWNALAHSLMRMRSLNFSFTT